MRITGITYCLFVGLASLTGLGSCKKGDCKNSDIKTYSLEQKERNAIYYKGKDSVVFVSSTDTLLYTSGDRKQYYNKSSDGSTCEGFNVHEEGLEVVLKDSSGQDVIYHNHYVSAKDSSSSFITVVYQDVLFRFKYRTLSLPYTRESFLINGKTYMDVAIITGHQNDADSLYYNLDNGIIRLAAHSKGKTLQLY